ncbi:MAG: hypothetical protein VX431_00845 [Planctomycetota bacterium]|nr:hypothetical protein [Planctomycetota bacterium]
MTIPHQTKLQLFSGTERSGNSGEKASSVRRSVAPPRATFRPALEVDHFSIPPVCQALCQRSEAFAGPLLEAIGDSSRQAMRILLLASGERGTGNTTVGIWLAATLAKTSQKICLVDANIENPDIARQLGIDPDGGWRNYAENKQCVSELLIESIADRFVILPCSGLPEASRWQADWDLASILESLRDHFELVLIDSMTMRPEGLGQEMLQDCGPFIDAALWIDSSATDTMWAQRQLQDAGVRLLGRVQRAREIAQAA